MDKFDIKSAKYVSIILLICFIFIMVVWNAYNYLPSENSSGVVRIQNSVELPDDNTASVNAQNNDDEDTQIADDEDEEDEDFEASDNTVTPEKPVSDIQNPRREALIPLENLSEDGAETDSADNLTSVLENADKYKSEKQFVKAIDEFKKAADITDDSLVKAECYEEIANIYAVSKRYGSALAFANRAYNISPTASREVLLARLYYKTGDIDRATKKVNNLLQKDFTIED